MEKYVIKQMVKYRWDADLYVFWRNVYKNIRQREGVGK